MFSSPLTIAGVVIAAFGWLWLVIGVGRYSFYVEREIINFHAVSLANNVILLGYVLIVAGIIGRGFAALAGQGSPAEHLTKRQREAQAGDMQMTDDEQEQAELLERRMMERGIRR